MDGYTIDEIPCATGGRGFCVAGGAEMYWVNIGKYNTCECMGFLRRDNCKHIAMVKDFIKEEGSYGRRLQKELQTEGEATGFGRSNPQARPPEDAAPGGGGSVDGREG